MRWDFIIIVLSDNLRRIMSTHDRDFGSLSMQKAARSCYLCGSPFEQWALIGGGYEDNWFAALLREAFPIAICESCFRRSFYKVSGTESVGLAVLPCVEARSLRALEIEKFLLAAKRSHGSGSFEADHFLGGDEIAVLVADSVIYRAVFIDSRYGTVRVKYTFNPVVNEGLDVRLSRTQPEWLSGIAFGFVPEMRVEMVSSVSDYVREREVKDFYWLRDKFMLIPGSDQTLPLLSTPLVLGEDLEAPMSNYLGNLRDFLCLACTTEPFRSSRALQAFFRPGFAVGRAVVDVQDEAMLMSRGAFGPPLTLAPYQDIASKLNRVLDRLVALKAASEASQQLHQELVGQFARNLETIPLAKQLRSLKRPPVATMTDFVPVDVLSFVQDQIDVARANAEYWEELADFLHT